MFFFFSRLTVDEIVFLLIMNGDHIRIKTGTSAKTFQEGQTFIDKSVVVFRIIEINPVISIKRR